MICVMQDWSLIEEYFEFRRIIEYFLLMLYLMSVLIMFLHQLCSDWSTYLCRFSEKFRGT